MWHVHGMCELEVSLFHFEKLFLVLWKATSIILFQQSITMLIGFVCDQDHDSVYPYGRSPIAVGYKCSVCVWPGPWLSVSLWEVSNCCRLKM